MRIFSLASLSAILIVAVLGAYPAHTEQSLTAGEDGGQKISLAGRQRTLLQLMANSACFAVLGIDAENHVRDLLKAHETFDQTLKALAQGSPPQRLLPETNPDVLMGLKGVASRWVRYSRAIESVAEHYKDKSAEEPLRIIYEINPGLVLEMSDTVTRFEDVYAHPGDARRAALLGAINIASRQGMLSQKMAKEFCMTASGYNSGESRILLLGTMALFESTQDWLAISSVDLDLTESQTDYLFARKSRAERVWQLLREVYARTKAGGAPTQDELAAVAVFNRELLSELNEVAKYYETLYAAPGDGLKTAN